MNINATLFGQGILIVWLLFTFIVTVICYSLGKRKTQNPKLIAIIGFISATIPPIAMVLLVVLACKRDVDKP